MAHYVVLNFDVHDAARFAEYARQVPATRVPDMKVLVFDKDPRNLEGRSHERLVILEFENEQSALDWYHSSGYARIAGLRRASTIGWVRSVPQFDANGSRARDTDLADPET